MSPHDFAVVASFLFPHLRSSSCNHLQLPTHRKYLKKLTLNITSSSPTYSAVQIDWDLQSNPPVPDCRVVGEYTSTKFEVRLLDLSDPSAGIQLEYEGGEKCTHGGFRTFNIDMPCADRLNPRPSSAYELKHCAYTSTLPSIYGCPLECPVADRRLCGGHGLCKYDEDEAAARCFCFDGWKGKDCNDKKGDSSDDLNYSPALLGLIVTLFVIIGFLVAGIVMLIRQVQAYKEDVTHYQMLGGGDENDGAGGAAI